MTRVARMVELARPVADLERAARFYVEALGFAPRPDGDLPDLPDLLATCWGRPVGQCLGLRLGRQSLLLAACAPHSLPDAADDPRFQHIAIVTPDMEAAWARLQARGAPLMPISQGGPQRLPAASGGVTACKFRDPDGHAVELLAFDPGAVPARWAGAGGAITLGIDHSAVTVQDADRSAAFYAAELGLRAGAGQRNRGPEQARLDGLPAPEVDVLALHPAEGDSPHLELLGYRPPRPRAAPAAGPRDTTVWNGAGASRWLADPDGHLHLLLP